MNAVEKEIPEMKLAKFARHRAESFAESQKQPGEKIEHRLTNNPPHADSVYPKAKYHPHKAHIVVRNAEDEKKRSPAEDGWVDTPAKLPPSAVRDFSTEEKLAMLDQICQLVGVEPGQSPVEILEGLLAEYTDFAHQLAALNKPEDAAKKKGRQG